MGNAKPALRDEDTDGADTHGEVDPKPDPVGVTSRRIDELVCTIDIETRKDWSATRDAMDDLMRAHAARGQEIAREVTAYAAEAEQLINVSKVIRDEAERARGQIGQRPAATVTALRARG